MAVEDTWLLNLKALVEAEGGGRKGIRIVADIADLSEEYVYQLVSGKPNAQGVPRSVGKGAANKIAKGFANGRSLNWFDLPYTVSASDPFKKPEPEKRSNLTLRATIDRLGDLLAQADEKTRQSVAQLLLQYAQDPTSGERIAQAIDILMADASKTP